MCRGSVGDDLYAVLNLESLAGEDEVRKAYRRAALCAHPDKGGSSDAFHLISFAFEVLSCPAARRLYDHDQACRRSASHPILAKANSLKAMFTKTTCACTEQDEENCKATDTNRSGNGRDVEKKHCKKRTAPHRGFEARAVKRCCNLVAHNDISVVTSAQLAATARVDNTLERLREVLAPMAKSERLQAIQKLSLQVRSALVSFMEKSPSKRVDDKKLVNLHEGYKMLRQSPPISGLSGIRVIKSTHHTKYTAHIGIKGLRLYTCGHEAIETAIEHHIILMQIRQAIAEASTVNPAIWDNPTELHQVYSTVLHDSGTSENMLGLNTFIYMRASKWLGRSRFITSTCMTFAEASELYSRLAHACRTSWENFRAEWIKLMQGKKRSQVRRLSYDGAAAIADQARQSALTQFLPQAARAVERALEQRKKALIKVAKRASVTAASTKHRQLNQQMQLRKRAKQRLKHE